MKELDEFLPNVRMYAPGVSDPVAFFAIRQAAIDFCERSRMWRWEDEFSITADDYEDLIAPDGAVIHEIEAVWFNGHKITKKKTPKELDECLPGWRSDTENRPEGDPTYITQTAPNTMVLAPFGTGTVKVSVYLKPSQDCEQLPDFLADQHRETIAWGALARILMIPNQSFTDPNMAAVWGQSFQNKLDGKADAGITGQQRARVRTKASFM